ncbi:hypothetical protein GCM10022388_21490 [Flavobacterium chungnamense]|uniref:Uncharacterized protein n=1 Tax=Flavobacterium chungnamense TaxID=706182 RepID=A0ABP7UX29_9FLAO
MFFSVNSLFAQNKALSDGKYLVKLDSISKKSGFKDYEVYIEKESVYLILANKMERLEIVWIDDKSFKILGLTEPLNPTELQKKILKDTNICFEIITIVGNECSFKLEDKKNNRILNSGTFVKI